MVPLFPPKKPCKSPSRENSKKIPKSLICNIEKAFALQRQYYLGDSLKGPFKYRTDIFSYPLIFLHLNS